MNLQCRKQWWKLRVPPPGGLLVCGTTISSRTALTGLLGDVLAHHPDCQAHVVHVDCQSIETETLSSAEEELEKHVQPQPM